MNLGLATCSDDKSVKIYDLRSNQLLQHYNAHKGSVNDISFHPTGLYMASGSTDSKVKIWDLRKGKALFSLYSHTGSVNSVDFSFAGDYFATGGSDKNLLIWKSNFYDSRTRENDMIKPKTKLVNDKVVKFNSKVATGEELPEMRASHLSYPARPNQTFADQIGPEHGIGISVSEQSQHHQQGMEIVEVKADEKISGNLDRIMTQMDKLFIMLKVAV